ncbi:hypothetical protein TWF481_011751 [Arthrobotrys musiformis]|uniref:Uncharacterized protein n=1 Tax=Arthrobotrys musiformis TaxID=47236 RepID=A0AAV9VV14_9PEZI
MPPVRVNIPCSYPLSSLCLLKARCLVPWRGIFGQMGLLAACSRGLRLGDPENILKQNLRLIGNCCADNDPNRDVVIETECYDRLTRLSAANPPLQPLIMVVIFNFMNEYEPAQRHAIKHGLVEFLTEVIGGEDKEPGTKIEYALRCLELVLQLDVSLGGTVSELIISLLDLATRPDTQFDIFHIVLGCFPALHKEEYTKAFNLDPIPILSYINLITKLQHWENNLSRSPGLISDDIDKEDITRLIRAARGTAIATISEISSSGPFQDQYPAGTEFSDSVVQLLASSDPNLLTSAALILGNMARDAAACDALVQKYQLHLSLVNILKEQNQIGVLHAAGGALKNLVIGSPAIRQSVVRAGIFQYCQKFYLASVMIEVQHMGLSLVRILVAMSPENVESLLLPLEGDSSSSAISQVLELYAKNTEAPIRMEIGRIVVSILREAAKSQSSGLIKSYDPPLQQKVLDMCPRILEPVIDMVTQDKWPVIASEGWFALALCVQTTGGANAIANLTFSEVFFQALRRALKLADGGVSESLEPTLPEQLHLGSNGPGSKPSIQSQKDKENICMFLSGFLKHNASETLKPCAILLQQFLDQKEVTDIQIKEAIDSQ